jgi:urease accessory protein
MDDLVGGFLHPLLVPAHAVALAGLGLLLGRQAPARRWAALAVFAVALAAGLAAIAAGTGDTGAATAILVVTLVLGVLVALARPLPASLVGMAAAATGLTLALDSPPEAVSLAAADRMLIGTGCGAVIVVAVLAAATARLREWQLVAVRIVGSWLAAVSMLTLAMRFTGQA